MGLGHTYIKPFELGWKFKRAVVLAWYAFMPPTGRYNAGAIDNTGRGL